MEFPVDVLASIGHEKLESSAHSYMSDLLYIDPDHSQHFTLTTGRKVRISLSNVGFVPLYGANLKHKVLALFAPEDQFTAVALLLDDKWYAVDDILRTANPLREGLVKVRSVGERIVLYVLNRIVYRTNEMSAGEMPFLCHGENEIAKILWKNGEAVGFYSVKPKGSVCSNFVSQCYLLPVMDSIFVRRGHRGQGHGLQMLEDFVDSFKDDELGLKFPLSPAMSQVCRHYLDRYPADMDLLWEVEGVGGPYQRTRVANKLSTPTLKGRLFSCGKDDYRNGQTTQDKMEMTEETSIDITEEIIVVNKRLKAAEDVDDTPISTRTRSSEHKRQKRMREENEESVAESQPEKISRVGDLEPVLAPATVMLKGEGEDAREEAENLVPADRIGEVTMATEAPAAEQESEEQALEVNRKLAKKQEEELNEEVETDVAGEEAQESNEAEPLLQNGAAGEEEEGMDFEEPVQEKDGMKNLDKKVSLEAAELQEDISSPAAEEKKGLDEDKVEENTPPAAEDQQKGASIHVAEAEEKLDASSKAADEHEVAAEAEGKMDITPEAEVMLDAAPEAEKDEQEVPLEAEETQEEAPEAEETQDVALEANEAQEVAPEAEETRDIASEAEETQDVAPEAEETQDVAPEAEETQEVAPEIEDTQEVAPVVEETQKVAPEVEESQEVAPEVEETQEVAPEVEETEEVAPEVEETEEVAPEVEETQEVAPEVEETQEVAPEVEETQEVAPEVEETQEVASEVGETQEVVVAPEAKEKQDVAPEFEKEHEMALETAEKNKFNPKTEEIKEGAPEEEEKQEIAPEVDEKNEVAPEEKQKEASSDDQANKTKASLAKDVLEEVNNAPSEAQQQGEAMETEESPVEQEGVTETSEELPKEEESQPAEEEGNSSKEEQKGGEGNVSAMEEDECKEDSSPALDIRVLRGGRSKAVPPTPKRSSKRLSRKEVPVEGDEKEEGNTTGEEEMMTIDEEKTAVDKEMAPAEEEKMTTTDEELEHSSEEEEEPPVIDRRVLRGKIKVIQTMSQPRAKRRSRK